MTLEVEFERNQTCIINIGFMIGERPNQFAMAYRQDPFVASVFTQDSLFDERILKSVSRSMVSPDEYQPLY